MIFIPANIFGMTAVEIIREVEKVMFPNAKSDVTLTFKDANNKPDIYRMKIYTKDTNQKVIVRFTAPAQMIESDLIMLERNVWSYNPKAGRIIMMPSNQSFGGTDFSYGDVVRLNLSDNYEGVIKSETNDSWILELTAKHRSAPYFRIEYEVRKNGFIPVKSVCYSKNGNLIKTLEFSDIRTYNNKQKPATITVNSPYEKGRVSIMTTDSEEPKDLPDNLFNKRNLPKRLEEKY